MFILKWLLGWILGRLGMAQAQHQREERTKAAGKQEGAVEALSSAAKDREEAVVKDNHLPTVDEMNDLFGERK